MAERLVVDASAMVDILIGSPPADKVIDTLRERELHAPAHFDAEILSALGRLQRAGRLSARQAASRLSKLADSPIQRHPLAPLLAGAWSRRNKVRLVDGLYIELASQLDTKVVSTDKGLAGASALVALIS